MIDLFSSFSLHTETLTLSCRICWYSQGWQAALVTRLQNSLEPWCFHQRASQQEVKFLCLNALFGFLRNTKLVRNPQNLICLQETKKTFFKQTWFSLTSDGQHILLESSGFFLAILPYTGFFCVCLMVDSWKRDILSCNPRILCDLLEYKRPCSWSCFL